MRAVIECLRNLQTLVRDPSGTATPQTSKVQELRRRIPSAVLVNFDSMIKRGRTGIAAAANGVCSGCHLKLCSGTVSEMQHPNALQRCDHCGRYVFVQESIRPSNAGQADYFMVPGAAAAPKKRLRRKVDVA